MDPRFEPTTIQKLRTVEIDTILFDQENYGHEVNLRYELMEPNIICEYGIRFIQEAKFEGFKFIQEVVQELIEGLEHTRDLEYHSQLIIE